MPSEVYAASRLVEAVCHLGDGLKMYFASLYGPAYGRTHIDPWTLLAGACDTAFQNAAKFRGPAAVVGDFNVLIEDVPHWPRMQAMGWVDTIDFDAKRRGVDPNPTSKDKVRKSFILINPQLVAALSHCDTDREFDFNTHPLLKAEFDFDVVRRPLQVWSLPQSTDKFLFDHQTFNESVDRNMAKRAGKFETALQRADSEEALRQINVIFEHACQDSNVDVVGQPVKFPMSCLGRGRKPVTKLVQPAAPVTKSARQGHYMPELCQPTMHIRRRAKQVRRLQSLRSQLAALNSQGRNEINAKCWELWQCILSAKGFPGGFRQFAFTALRVFVPSECPGYEFVKYLANALMVNLQAEVVIFKQQERAVHKVHMAEDIQRGGSKAYAAVRDLPVVPFQTIERTAVLQVARLKWPKSGRNVITVRGDTGQLDLGLPVVFHEQKAFITKIDGQFIHLDSRFKLRSGHVMTLSQTHVVCDPTEVQQLTCDAWGCLWKRDPAADDMPTGKQLARDQLFWVIAHPWRSNHLR